ncbi:hypothetical protein Q4498_06870 [Neptunomonas phycophila]|nr:hypothetical protein [Neptunomonas phycophila]MDO6467835.1 hypothetical protein [Neptunomonas phycophila]
MEAVAASAIISILIFICSAILVVYGWETIYENAQKIASRNELFSRKTALIVEIQSLAISSIEFWETEHDYSDKNKCLLKSSIFTYKAESINKRLKRLKSFGLEADLSNEMRMFRKNITLDAERAFDISSEAKREKISCIFSSSDSLKEHLSYKFEEVYKHKFP